MNMDDDKESTLPQNEMLLAAEALLLNAPHYTRKDYHSVCQSVSQFECCCQEAGYSHSEINDGRFFICAFLDAQVAWDSSTLLTTFYEPETIKKNDFFQRLKRRQYDIKKYIDLLELAYFCLNLGEQDDQSNQSDQNVMTVIDRLYHDIRNSRNNIAPSLSIINNNPRTRHWRYPPVWLTAIITLAILIAIFIPYHKKLNQHLAPTLNTLHHLIPTLRKDHEN